MYHYVRRLAMSRYPEIKGLERDDFIWQLSYFKKNYNVVTSAQVSQAAKGEGHLPAKSMLLTFDDGYLDHFTNVWPVLEKYKMHGCFFPPARCISDAKVLDVNKIHYILATVSNKSHIVDLIDVAINNAKIEFDLEIIEEYRARYFIADRFDTSEVIYIKRMLQVGLPEVLRNKITDELFRRFVSADEQSFARELYMDEDQVRCLVESGMTVGSHGYNHEWLNKLDQFAQEREVDLSLEFLDRVGVSRRDWVMCYPYGGWNETLLDVLRRRNCGFALTTEVGVADLSRNDLLLLPRLDTNDFPSKGYS